MDILSVLLGDVVVLEERQLAHSHVAILWGELQGKQKVQ
jgi:hypothetical protein